QSLYTFIRGVGNMKIESKLYNNTLFIAIYGELDEYTAVYTRNELDRIISENEMKRVVVDLSELSFMDSTGVGILIGRFKKLRAKNIPIFIANPSKTVDKIFSMTGLYEIMPKIG
ncbi:MAG TPA: STAS domain-containing protein, partial [Clostridia bacterium]